MLAFMRITFLFCIVISICTCCGTALADTKPLLNQGKKWRIGYYEGGPYTDYVKTMRTLVQALMEMGWLENADIPAISGVRPKPFWSWLSRSKSKYLSFEPQDAYSANWEDVQRARNRAMMMQKLRAGELDLVIAVGTWAGQDLANNQHKIPIIVISTSDPIRAGIIKSVEDSGLDHVTARVDPKRYLRQIRMFHRITRFKTLGVAYEDTEEGLLYSAMAEVNQVAKERGFKVNTCKVVPPGQEPNETNQSCRRCYNRLAQQSDAVYLTALSCADHITRELADIFIKAKVPSFAQLGSYFVKQGIMFSISSDSGYLGIGRYHAEKIARILNGEKPGSLEQLFKDPLFIAVNLRTVKEIGFNMPKSILRIASDIYE
jgi:ABC-type uncharacterized transport system substrate-binding protein